MESSYRSKLRSGIRRTVDHRATRELGLRRPDGVRVLFFLIRPANKQRKEHEQVLNSLKKGDEVVTNGGLWARVVSIDDSVATVELADKVKVRILKDRIAGKWAITAPAKK